MIDNCPNFQIKASAKNIPKNFFEKTAWQVQKVVCGVDEVGRGCLAGPLVTAAVILPSGKTNALLKDSKMLSEQERLAAYTWIKKNCFYGIGIVSHRLIDRHNIWQATLLAMQQAVLNAIAVSSEVPAALLIDAMPLKLTHSVYQTIPVYHFPKGEQKSSSIAAASIIAKVWRDDLIKRLNTPFPGYELHEHKGYATKKHRLCLATQPVSLIHRLSFLKKEHKKKEIDAKQQQSLC